MDTYGWIPFFLRTLLSGPEGERVRELKGSSIKGHSIRKLNCYDRFRSPPIITGAVVLGRVIPASIPVLVIEASRLPNIILLYHRVPCRSARYY